jgi:radical SAM superfamily enzyme YgiQ (UPF0313 family)
MKVKTDSGEEITVQFADDFFDGGSPEEMQELLAVFVEKLKDGSLFEDSEPISIEDLSEEEADELMAALDAAEKKITLQ